MGPSQADVGTKEAPRVCLDGPLKVRLESSSHDIKDLRCLLIVLEASAAVQGGRLCLAQKGATGEVQTQSVSALSPPPSSKNSIFGLRSQALRTLLF